MACLQESWSVWSLHSILLTWTVFRRAGLSDHSTVYYLHGLSSGELVYLITPLYTTYMDCLQESWSIWSLHCILLTWTVFGRAGLSDHSTVYYLHGLSSGELVYLITPLYTTYMDWFRRAGLSDHSMDWLQESWSIWSTVYYLHGLSSGELVYLITPLYTTYMYWLQESWSIWSLHCILLTWTVFRRAGLSDHSTVYYLHGLSSGEPVYLITPLYTTYMDWLQESWSIWSLHCILLTWTDFRRAGLSDHSTVYYLHVLTSGELVYLITPLYTTYMDWLQESWSIWSLHCILLTWTDFRRAGLSDHSTVYYLHGLSSGGLVYLITPLYTN